MELAPRMKHSRAGLVSMVNNGQNMHGSQVKRWGNILFNLLGNVSIDIMIISRIMAKLK
jgi:hypothetical protein